tara:strand:+ start:178 stop:789 length:612 start_codon:yes stop_codon:yes gene_type:complete
MISLILGAHRRFEKSGHAAGGLGSMMQALSLFLGLIVIITSLTAFTTGMAPAQVLSWGLDMLGSIFLLLLSALVITAIFCCVRLIDSACHAPSDLERQKWLQAGLQACNGIATLALTFTLLGISLGIGQLSNSSLTPDSIDKVIASLTDDFSMAFLTSVIGLPLSAILRTVFIVLNASLAFGSTPSTIPASVGDKPVTTLSLS